MEAVIAAIDACEDPPFVLAHSLGGLAALHAAAHRPIARMALLSPVPLWGMRPSIAALAKRSPLSVVKFAAALTDARLTRLGSPPVGIYSDRCDPARANAITQRLRSESLPVMLQLLAPPRLDMARLDAERILFLGATGDHIIAPPQIRHAAETLGSACHIYDGLSHTYQAEPEWPQVASDVLAWFRSGVSPATVPASTARGTSTTLGGQGSHQRAA